MSVKCSCSVFLLRNA